MSHQALQWAFEQDAQPPAAKFVLVTLAHHHNGRTNACHPGADLIASETGMTERSVRSHLQRLEDLDLIQRERRTNDKGHRQADAIIFVGLHSLPEDISARTASLPETFDTTLPANSAGSPPETVSGRDESLPETFAVPTGNFRQSLPETFAETYMYEQEIEQERNRNIASAAAPPPKASSEKTPRAPDPIWDTLVEIHHFTPTSKTPEHGRWNKAVGIYRAIGAGPPEIHQAYRLYRRKFPNADANANAVAGRAEALLTEHAASNGHNDDRYVLKQIAGEWVHVER